MNIVKTPQKKDIKKTRENNSFAEMPNFKEVTFVSGSVSFHLSDARIIGYADLRFPLTYTLKRFFLRKPR